MSSTESGKIDDLGVVIIGRNEGPRLRCCLESVVTWASRVVYVDSASDDDSVAVAESAGVRVVELDRSMRLTAARGRAEGTRELLSQWPGTPYIFFVDGDCEVIADWPDKALEALNGDPSLGVVCGRRRESDRGASAYNRLMDLEWDRPAGEVDACGGDSVIRTEALLQSGGFDPNVVAGEEPELCWRLRNHGWRIRRLATEMTRHDSAITKFSQWWRREIRSGFGSLDVWVRTGAKWGGPFWPMIRRGLFWGLLLPVATLLSVGVCLVAERPAWALAVVSLALLLHLVSASRSIYRFHRQGMAWSDSVLGAWTTVAGRWAQTIGYWQWLRTPRSEFQANSSRRDAKACKNDDSRDPAASTRLPELDRE